MKHFLMYVAKETLCVYLCVCICEKHISITSKWGF